MLYRVICIFAAWFIVVAVALAGEKVADDNKNLQGTWQAVGLEGSHVSCGTRLAIILRQLAEPHAP